MEIKEAEEWPDLIDIVSRIVKPERLRQKDKQGKQYWWRFLRPRVNLYETIKPLKRCLVTAAVSKHCMMSFQPTWRVFANTLYVFALTEYAHFALLQSRVHEFWAWLLSSTMRNAGIRYTASDCFETFPFPPKELLGGDGEVEAGGKELYESRAAYMVGTQQGLTDTDNKLKGPDCHDAPIVMLRQQHEAIDKAVLAAYGWGDIEVPPYLTPVDHNGEPTPSAAKALQAFKDEVIDRLMALNAERAAAEAPKPKKTTRKKTSKKPSSRKTPNKSDEQTTLL